MIDEDVLRALLADAADAAPPPGGLPDALFAAPAGEGSDDGGRVPAASRRPRSLRVLAVAAAAVVALGVGAAVVGGDGGGRSGETAARSSGTAPRAATSGGQLMEEDDCPGCLVEPVAPADGDAFGGAAAPSAGDSAAVGTGGDAATGSTTGGDAGAGRPTDSAMVVKTGSMSIELPKGSYRRVVDRVTTKAAGLGGYVSASTSSRDDGRASGQLTVRVPADRFEPFLADLRRLGEVVAEDAKGSDVGGQHADLEARLAALRATRDKLGTILAQAKTVDETLAVQDRITGVQTQVEQLEAQLRVLEDQVAMSSVTLDLAEPGADRIDATDPDDRDLGGAWAEARRRFGDGVEDLVSWSGSAAVVLIVGAALLALARLAWPRLRRSLL